MGKWEKIRSNKWYQRTLGGNSTPGRWGLVTLLSTLSTFLLAVFLSLLVTYFSYESAEMVPLGIVVGLYIALAGGTACGLLGLILAIRWLIHPLSDPNQSDLRKIKLALGIKDDDEIAENKGNQEQDELITEVRQLIQRMDDGKID